jgi:hypothetical protein
MAQDLYYKKLFCMLQNPALAERTASSAEFIRTFKSDVTA